MIIANAWIRSTRADGTPVYHRRRCQIDQAPVNRDPGMVEIMADSSSALAPMLEKILYDVPGAAYQHGDIVTIVREDGQRGTPPANPFHVLRVQQPGAPLPATECRLARVDMLTQTAQWMQAIGPDTPGAAVDDDLDPTLFQITTDQGPSRGRGYMAPHPTTGVLCHGYFTPAVPTTIGLNEYAQSTEIADIGIVNYSHPVVIYEAPLQLGRFDVLVLADGRRLVVSALQHRLQRMDVVLAILQMTEWKQPGDVVYSLALT